MRDLFIEKLCGVPKCIYVSEIRSSSQIIEDLLYTVVNNIHYHICRCYVTMLTCAIGLPLSFCKDTAAAKLCVTSTPILRIIVCQYLLTSLIRSNKITTKEFFEHTYTLELTRKTLHLPLNIYFRNKVSVLKDCCKTVKS